MKVCLCVCVLPSFPPAQCLDDIWLFFELPRNATEQELRSKMKRQRLLLHPDKNQHPDAEKTFKFLEQCNQRLIDCCMRRSSGHNESAAQRTRREEDELRKEEEKRKKQEEEWQATQEKIRREEEEKIKQEERDAQKADADRRRYEKMLRDKEIRFFIVDTFSQSTRLPHSV